VLEKQMPLEKPMFFAYVIIISKRNQNLAKKKTGNETNQHEKFGAV